MIDTLPFGKDNLRTPSHLPRDLNLIFDGPVANTRTTRGNRTRCACERWCAPFGLDLGETKQGNTSTVPQYVAYICNEWERNREVQERIGSNQSWRSFSNQEFW